MNKHEIFIAAIHKMLIVEVKVNSQEKGIINRMCVPFDFGPSKRYKDGVDRYHFYDLDSPEGKHNLSILPVQLLDISLTENNFDPAHYVTWTPSWIVARDWGRHS